MLVLGAGPGGYSAAFRAADLGLSTVLVERYDTLGGVCLNVGCIPSAAAATPRSSTRRGAGRPRHQLGEPKIDLDKLRGYSDSVVAKLTGGLAGMAKARKVTVAHGVGEFVDPHHLKVTGKDGKVQTLRFKQAIIAAGSQSVKLPFLPQDERIVDSTARAAARDPQEDADRRRRHHRPGNGHGVLHAGRAPDVVEMLDGLMQGADRDMVKVWQKKNAYRFDNIMLKTKTVGAEAKKDGIYVSFEGEARREPQRYDLVLRPQPQRQEDRRRQGGHRRHRPRFHRGRQADAHQRAAHLRHRRHRGPAHAGAQGA